jgi:hypothetical protein
VIGGGRDGEARGRPEANRPRSVEERGGRDGLLLPVMSMLSGGGGDGG